MNKVIPKSLLFKIISYFWFIGNESDLLKIKSTLNTGSPEIAVKTAAVNNFRNKSFDATDHFRLSSITPLRKGKKVCKKVMNSYSPDSLNESSPEIKTKTSPNANSPKKEGKQLNCGQEKIKSKLSLLKKCRRIARVDVHSEDSFGIQQETLLNTNVSKVNNDVSETRLNTEDSGGTIKKCSVELENILNNVDYKFADSVLFNSDTEYNETSIIESVVKEVNGINGNSNYKMTIDHNVMSEGQTKPLLNTNILEKETNHLISRQDKISSELNIPVKCTIAEGIFQSWKSPGDESFDVLNEGCPEEQTEALLNTDLPEEENRQLINVHKKIPSKLNFPEEDCKTAKVSSEPPINPYLPDVPNVNEVQIEKLLSTQFNSHDHTAISKSSKPVIVDCEIICDPLIKRKIQSLKCESTTFQTPKHQEDVITG